MLEAVIEQINVAIYGVRISVSITANDYVGFRDTVFDEQRFVHRAIAARQDRYALAARDEMLGDGDDGGCFSGAARGGVADGDHRLRPPLRFQDAGAIDRAANAI